MSLLAADAAAIRVFSSVKAPPGLVVALALGAGSCAVSAWRILRRVRCGVGVEVGWVLARHSLIGPIVLLELACTLTSRNDSLTVRP